MGHKFQLLTPSTVQNETEEIIDVQIGSENVELSCEKSKTFVYCGWKHDNDECKFEWSFKFAEFRKKDCTLNDNIELLRKFKPKLIVETLSLSTVFCRSLCRFFLQKSAYFCWFL